MALCRNFDAGHVKGNALCCAFRVARQAVEDIVEELYGATPTGTLYHYTTLEGIQGILSERGLWATDIHYFNDFAELRQTATLMSAELRERGAAGGAEPQILTLV